MPRDLDPQLPRNQASGFEPMIPGAVPLKARVEQIQAALDGTYHEQPEQFAAAIPLLVEALNGRNASLACAAAEIIRTLGPVADQAVPALVAVALRKRLRVGGAASRSRGQSKLIPMTIEALRQIGEPSVSALIDALADDDVEVVLRAIDLLGDFGPLAEPAVPALLAAARRRDISVRNTAAAALKRIQRWNQTRRLTWSESDGEG